MAVYTVHEPPLKQGGNPLDPERFVFVRDGFSFWAFLLAPLWMLWHRLWLVFLGYVLITIALHMTLSFLGASAGVTTAVGVLLALLVGFEAASLRRFTLARRRWRNAGIVVGDDLESAERRFFDIWIGKPVAGGSLRPASAVAAAVPIMRRSSPDIIGLFPEAGAPR